MRTLTVGILAALLVALAVPMMESAGPVTDGCTSAVVGYNCVFSDSWSFYCYGGQYTNAFGGASAAGTTAFYGVGGGSANYCGSQYNSIGGGACVYGQSFTCASANWYGYDAGSYHYCGTFVSVYPIVSDDVGCPAGNPPTVGWAVLP